MKKILHQSCTLPLHALAMLSDIDILYLHAIIVHGLWFYIFLVFKWANWKRRVFKRHASVFKEAICCSWVFVADSTWHLTLIECDHRSRWFCSFVISVLSKCVRQKFLPHISRPWPWSCESPREKLSKVSSSAWLKPLAMSHCPVRTSACSNNYTPSKSLCPGISSRTAFHKQNYYVALYADQKFLLQRN